jgi:signal transduction histidine kinase
MADSTVYMQQLIHDLIDLSRVGRSGVEPIEVDLGRLVRAIAEDAGAANPAAEIRVGRLPVVTGDPTGFRQLFTNLLENAIRHGGRPDLAVVVDGRDHPDGAVELSVRDNGKGIPPEHRERVFGVFERLEGPSTGRAPRWAWPSAARSSRSWAGPSPSSATTAPTSASCSPAPSGPTGRPSS